MATLIKTIYDDAQHTNEIAPRTKFSAVTDDEGHIIGKVGALTFQEITGSVPADFLYPVGSIYQTTDANFDPANIWGGTWELLSNKMPIGENVFGNGLALGLTNGINYAGLGGVISEDRPIRTARSLFGKNQDTSFSSNNTNVTQSIYGLGVPTKTQLGDNPQNSGLIIDSIECYTWRRTA